MSTQVSGSPEEVRATILEITHGQLPDITVDASGLTPVIMQAVDLTANLGQIILLGSPRQSYQGDLTRLLSEIHLRNLTMRGALEWILPEYPPTATFGNKALPVLSHVEKQQILFSWIDKGQLNLEPLISHRITPDAIQ